jgi:hypothetical protein
MEALRDMLGSSAPQSVRKLAKQLDLNKFTIWRWQMLVFSIIGSSSVAVSFSGIIEADEAYQREARTGSREWVRHFTDPKNILLPPRPRWEDFTTRGLKMMRGLSRWQLPILTVANLGEARLFGRLPNSKSATVERAMTHPVPNNAVLCSDGAIGYKDLAASRGLEHFVLGSKRDTRVAAGCYHMPNVKSLHARYGTFMEPFCGPATKNLDGYIRWLEARLEGVRPAEVVSAS